MPRYRLAWGGAVLFGVILMTSQGFSDGLLRPAEMQRKARWVREHLLAAPAPPVPFSFRYGSKASGDLLAAWPRKTTTAKLDGARTRHTLTWTDPKTNLVVRCVAVEYSDFPVVEWTVYLRNAGKAKTAILADVRALDVAIERTEKGEFVLRTTKGDSNRPDSYEPLTWTLGPGAARRFAPHGGRPTNGAFPYFNLQMPGGGLILAIGWPGQWSAAFRRDAERGLRVTAGQQQTRLRLEPGEEIRTPLIALLCWRGGDPVRAQNLWRRWMVAHNLPRPGGKPPRPIYVFCSGGFFAGLKVSEASEKKFIDALTRERIKIDYWWMDAGWYPCPSWPTVGTWRADPKRFPKGIRAVSDTVHARGMKLVLWFEPERVEPGTWLHKNHPEWLLGGKLLNLGDARARAWLTDHVDRFLREQGVDLYRQDFNMDPLSLWRANDAPDRQGMTENLHVQGYLAYWDALLRRRPGLLIDSCASGGRRNDLETLRRALPLLRSDYQSFSGDPKFAVGNQGHTYGLSAWIPYYGHGVYYNPKQLVYSVRSHMCPSFGIAVDVRKGGTDWDLYRRLVRQWRKVADGFLGDFYPLTPYSLKQDQWIAWQFHRPERGDGFVQAFRRDRCPEAGRLLRLGGLAPAARYEVTDLDANTPRTMSGRELTAKGLPVTIPARPGAGLIYYKKTAD